jgi:hypothetical protein
MSLRSRGGGRAPDPWGPELSWPVERPGRDPLSFALRLPAGWRAVDALQRPEGTDGSLDQLLPALARTVESGPVITVQGIYTFAADENPVFGTLTAALADVDGAPPESIGEPVRLSVGAGVRVRRIRELTLVPGGEPMAVMTLQYLLDTAHGGLALAFTTPQRGLFDELAVLFGKVAETCRLEGLSR